MTKVRIVGWRVQPIVMLDDGENLTPLPLDPVDIPAAEWRAFKARGDAQAVADLRSRYEKDEKPAANRAARRSRPKAK
jgi:hypothetical protein